MCFSCSGVVCDNEIIQGKLLLVWPLIVLEPCLCGTTSQEKHALNCTAIGPKFNILPLPVVRGKTISGLC